MIDELRKKISAIDAQLAKLFAERLTVARDIGSYKRENGLPVRDAVRECVVEDKWDSMLSKHDCGKYSRNVSRMLIDAAVSEQERFLNIYLIGMPGSGKTTLGKELADSIGMSFMDTDELVCENAGTSIEQLFLIEGEAGFRVRETESLKSCARTGRAVVATGGGIVIDAENVRIMENSGKVIYLRATAQQLVTRNLSGRPLVNDASDVDALLLQRKQLYESAADAAVDAFSQDVLQHLISLCIIKA